MLPVIWVLGPVYTPEKSSIDTQNGPFGKGTTFSKPSFFGIHVSFRVCTYIYIYVYKNILLCREILYATLQRCNMIFQPFFPRYYRLQGELGPGMGYGPGSWSFGMQPFVDVSFWIGKYPGNIKESLNNRFG